MVDNVIVAQRRTYVLKFLLFSLPRSALSFGAIMYIVLVVVAPSKHIWI